MSIRAIYLELQQSKQGARVGPVTEFRGGTAIVDSRLQWEN